MLLERLARLADGNGEHRAIWQEAAELIRAAAIFPVLGDSGLVIGTIDVESDRCNAFSSEDERFLGSRSIALKGLWRALPGEKPT